MWMDVNVFKNLSIHIMFFKLCIAYWKCWPTLSFYTVQANIANVFSTDQIVYDFRWEASRRGPNNSYRFIAIDDYSTHSVTPSRMSRCDKDNVDADEMTPPRTPNQCQPTATCEMYKCVCVCELRDAGSYGNFQPCRHGRRKSQIANRREQYVEVFAIIVRNRYVCAQTNARKHTHRHIICCHIYAQLFTFSDCVCSPLLSHVFLWPAHLRFCET